MAKKINFRNGYVNINLSDIIKNITTVTTISASSTTGKLDLTFHVNLLKELEKNVRIKKPVMAIIDHCSITDGTHTFGTQTNTASADHSAFGCLFETSTAFIIGVLSGLYYDTINKSPARFIIYKATEDITISY